MTLGVSVLCSFIYATLEIFEWLLVMCCLGRVNVCLPQVAPQAELVVKNASVHAGGMRDAGCIPGGKDPLEEGMATHSTEEPGGLQSMGSHRVRHDSD